MPKQTDDKIIQHITDTTNEIFPTLQLHFFQLHPGTRNQLNDHSCFICTTYVRDCSSLGLTLAYSLPPQRYARRPTSLTSTRCTVRSAAASPSPTTSTTAPRASQSAAPTPTRRSQTARSASGCASTSTAARSGPTSVSSRVVLSSHLLALRVPVQLQSAEKYEGQTGVRAHTHLVCRSID